MEPNRIELGMGGTRLFIVDNKVIDVLDILDYPNDEFEEELDYDGHVFFEICELTPNSNLDADYLTNLKGIQVTTRWCEDYVRLCNKWAELTSNEN